MCFGKREKKREKDIAKTGDPEKEISLRQMVSNLSGKPLYTRL